uniref:Uncharacterized protein n=1 Tax=Zonotrichia albicollis TaxID=44394 RepID=A0A8D2MDP7_ZONAL
LLTQTILWFHRHCLQKELGGTGSKFFPTAQEPLLLAFFLAPPLGSGSLRLAEVMEPVTLKKSSSRPWVLPWRLLLSLLMPLRMRSSLNCFSPHMNCTSCSSSGSLHFSSTASGSITSGSRKSFCASLCSQFSGRGYFLVSSCCTILSMDLCSRMSSTARFGPMPRMLPQ